MKCLNFTCQNEANGKFPCCDSYCGYTYKTCLSQMKKYQDGIINWKYLKISMFTHFSVEECIYYHEKLSKKRFP